MRRILKIKFERPFKSLLIVILFTLLSCAEKKEDKDKDVDTEEILVPESESAEIDLKRNEVLDSIKQELPKENVDSIMSDLEEDTDCVFNNNSFEFTTEAIKKYDPKSKYYWDSKERSAIVSFSNGDTLILHIGGCNHFSYSATYRTDSSKYKQDAYLFSKARWIAKNFFSNGFENYDKYILNKKFQLEEGNIDTPDKRFFSITDTTMAENEIYDGFYFDLVGNRTEISVSGYIN